MEQEIYRFFAQKNFENTRRFSNKYSPQPLKEFLQKYGNPQNTLNIIHVAGTNAKGSTCLYLSYIAQKLGHSTGTYLSPHFENLRERFLLQGKKISDADFHLLVKKYLPYAEELSFFDFLTALAFLYFADKKPDYVFLETGLGGRLDSTNVVYPQACILTSIGYDHQNILGNTLEEIALEKAGILKPNTRCFVFPQKEEVKTVIVKEAKKKQAPCIFLNKISSDDYREQNWQYALQIAQALWHNVPKISRPELKGRFETLSKNPPIFYDSGHNIQAAKKVIKIMKKTPYRWILATNTLKERNLKEVISCFRKELNLRLIDVKLIPPNFTDTPHLFYSSCGETSGYFSAQILQDVAQDKAKNLAILFFGSARFYRRVNLLVHS